MSLTAESEPVFSPDGRWIAYQSDESGREFQAPSTAGNPTFDVSRDEGRFVMLEIADATKETQLSVVLHAVEEIRRLMESSR